MRTSTLRYRWVDARQTEVFLFTAKIKVSLCYPVRRFPVAGVSFFCQLSVTAVTASQGMYVTGIPINARPPAPSEVTINGAALILIFNVTEEEAAAAAKGTLIKFP